jgi:hypothetical protein
MLGKKVTILALSGKILSWPAGCVLVFSFILKHTTAPPQLPPLLIHSVGVQWQLILLPVHLQM